MSWIRCPVCDLRNPQSTVRCTSCGADFDDPDVRAMAAAGGEELPAAALGEAGALSSDKFLGISIDSLVEGPALKKVALAGGLLLAGCFLVPVSIDFRELTAVWSALDQGPTFALLFPALAALLGIAAWAIPRGATWVRGALLGGLGLLGLLVCLPGLGALAGTPEKSLPIFALGLCLGGAALIVRVVYPKAREPRYLLIAAAALTSLGLLIPVAEPWQVLPVELRFYIEAEEGKSASPLAMIAEVFNRDPLVFFSCLYLLLPLALLPAAAAIAWPRPGGPWDKSGLMLRPLAWVLVLYVPLGLGLFVFNVLGWNTHGVVYLSGKVVAFEDFTHTALFGRARLAGLATAFALWAQLGAVAAYRHFRRDS